jgi:hypothetical protein
MFGSCELMDEAGMFGDGSTPSHAFPSKPSINSNHLQKQPGLRHFEDFSRAGNQGCLQVATYTLTCYLVRDIPSSPNVRLTALRIELHTSGRLPPYRGNSASSGAERYLQFFTAH